MRVFSLVALATWLGAGCTTTRSVLDVEDADGGSRTDPNLGDVQNGGSGKGAPPKYAGIGGSKAPPNFGNAGPDGGVSDASAEPAEPGNDLSSICGAHATCEPLQRAIDKVDLLFVIDNSNSMKEEQDRLTAQFEGLIAKLTTGDRGPGLGKFAAVKDLHLGVVSSDMGLSGIDEVKDCDDRGDDGILQHAVAPNAPASLMCDDAYPPFLLHDVDDGVSDAIETAKDLSCIAPLGTGGCGFEQQLEAALKALWPSVDPMAVNGFNRITFMPDRTGSGTLGHGDDEFNNGFLRNDPDRGPSMIAVVVLTDEDDGSSSNNLHFTPKKFLDPRSALYSQPLNLRNFYNPDELYPITRYVSGLRALRPDDERLVVFGAIAGVPPELVTEAQTRDVATNPMVREAFYDALLASSNMQEVPDPASMTTPENGTLKPACLTTDADGLPNGKAYPARRLVEVARGFGENGFVSSICDDDLSPGINALVDRIAARPGNGCLQRPLARNSDGLVHGCSLLWILPEDLTTPGAPMSCDQENWSGVLEPAGSAYERSGIDPNRLCKVTQLRVTDGEVKPDPNAKFKFGWYYDDFSSDAEYCARGLSRIAFMNEQQAADVPTGVRAILDCE